MGYEAIRLQRPLAVDDIVSVHYFEYSSNYYFEGECHDFWEFLYVDILSPTEIFLFCAI